MAQVGKIPPKTQQTFLDSITVRDVFADYAYTWRRFIYRRRVAINGDQQLPGKVRESFCEGTNFNQTPLTLASKKRRKDLKKS
jgi:hypothetical protein